MKYSPAGECDSYSVWPNTKAIRSLMENGDAAFQISPRGLTALVGMTITSLAAAYEMSVEECVYNMV